MESGVWSGSGSSRPQDSKLYPVILMKLYFTKHLRFCLCCSTAGRLLAYLLAFDTEGRQLSPIGVKALRLLVPALMNTKVEHSTPRTIKALNAKRTMEMANLRRQGYIASIGGHFS